MGYIGFEICEDSTENEPYFLEAVREKAVLLTAHLCQMMGVRPDQVNVKAKTGEKVGPVGRMEAIEARAVVLLEPVGKERAKELAQ